ncbi:MAG: hypothetical protein K2X77_20745 [Candidatus Obscuribacterales bacterium]|nr:hypothetical protein [Candidatus Obscuribacterales bacterium]
MSILKHALIFAVLLTPAITVAAIGQGLVGVETISSANIPSANDFEEKITNVQDVIKVATALTGVVGLAGASCMGLATKRKEKIDSRLIKAIALFPTMPLVVHMIGRAVLSQMH